MAGTTTSATPCAPSAPVLAQIRDLAAWPARDKRRLVAMIRSKGGNEYRYFALMANFARLREALNDVAESDLPARAMDRR